MPQMAPYNWLILFLLFNMIMIFLISFNNFMMIPLINKKMIYLKNLYIWKW